MMPQAPGVADRPLLVEAGNFPLPGDCLTVITAVGRLAAARKSLASRRLSLADMTELADFGDLSDRPSVNLKNLKLTEQEVAAAAIVEITFAAVSLCQTPLIERRPILGIDLLERQALIAIKNAWDEVK